jgi:hypothetical protein
MMAGGCSPRRARSGPVAGLCRVEPGPGDVAVLETAFARLEVPRGEVATLTRPLLTRAEAEQRLAELSTPAPRDARHRLERLITHLKAASRGPDAERVAVLRAGYAQSWAPSFGERKRLDQLEQLLLPELALVLRQPEDELRASLRAGHPIATASDPAPQESPWPGHGTTHGVRELPGLAPLGRLELTGRAVIGPRVDRHPAADAGLAFVPVASGLFSAHLESSADDDAPLALVLLGHETEPPVAWDEVAATKAWEDAPGAPLVVLDEAALADARVMDAARYLGETAVYWERAVTVTHPDGLPERVSVQAPHGAPPPYRALRIVVAAPPGDDEGPLDDVG